MSDALDEQKERDAAEAVQRIKSGNHWADWRLIAEGFEVGRRYALRQANTNQPVGRAYNTAFGGWIDKRPWARVVDKATRNHLFWYLDHAGQVEAWRETLADNQRMAWTHPTTIWRRYNASHHTSADKPAETRTPMQRANDRIVELQEENDRLKRELERAKRDADQGSLFDLKGDTAPIIARVIRAHVGRDKRMQIAKLLREDKAPAG